MRLKFSPEKMKIRIVIFFNYWLPPILWAALIFSLSGVPNLNSGLEAFWDVFLRKLVHATEFGVLFLLLFRAWRGYDFKFWPAWFLSLILAAGYAFLDEFHQLFVLERQGKFFDIFIDSLGILFCAAIILFFKLRKK